MTIRLSTAHKNIRISATRDIIDAGAANGKLQIWTEPRIATLDDLPAGTKLLEMEFSKPCGTITDGILALSFTGPAVGLADGVAAWALFLDGNGVPVMDSEVGNLLSSALVRLTLLNITTGLPVEALVGSLG